MRRIWEERNAWLIGGVVLGLTIAFALDDWLIVLLVRELRLGIASDVALLMAAAALTVTNAMLALAVYRAMRRRPASGPDGLVGEEGRALRAFRSVGQVRVHGEIWRAVAARPIRKGERVRVIGVQGLTLHVAPEPRRS